MRVRKLAHTSAPAIPQIVATQKRRLERRAAATRSLLLAEKAAKNVTPISERPDLVNHPSMRMPLTFRYANPIGAGGWLGGIEPENEEWIAFVAIDGETLLWEQRETDGGVRGKPVLFQRKDLVPRGPIAAQKRRCEKATFSLDASAADGRFLIFAEGKIRTDYGMSVMTPEAGANVIKVFRERGNDMPIDLRHGMLSEKPTLEESLAYGWIPCPNGLQYVKGEGLYAVGVQWDPKVKAALESKPPKIKYHSPAYDQDPKTGVIISLDNIAITNLPATHNLRRMAAEKGRTKMDLKEAGKALVSLMQLVASAEGEALAQAQAALDALKMALGDQVDAAIEAAQAEEPAPESQDSFLAEMDPEERKAYEALPDGLKAKIASMKAAAAAPEVAAEMEEDIEAEKPEEAKVEAEAEKTDPVKASKFTEQDLALIEEGMRAKGSASRTKMVTEAIAAGKVHANMRPYLLDPATSDEVVTKFIAERKTVTRQVAPPSTTRLSQYAPAPKSSTTITASQKAQIAQIAAKTGTDPAKLEKKLAEMHKGQG